MNLFTSSDSAQPQTHRNVILMRFLAPMFYTPYTQTENIKYSSSLFYFCFHFMISTLTYFILDFFCKKKKTNNLFLPQNQLSVKRLLKLFCTYLSPLVLFLVKTKVKNSNKMNIYILYSSC